MWPLEDFTHALDSHTRFWMDGLESKVTCESCGLVGRARPSHAKKPKPFRTGSAEFGCRVWAQPEGLKVSATRVLE
jgi:hypothetical protein